MNKNEIKTITTNTLYCFADALVSTFVSVYLYVYADSLIIMNIYTMIRIALFPISHSIGLKFANKLPFTVSYALGLALIVCSLVYALFGTPLFEINSYYVLGAAVFTGLGEGFYYFSASTLNQTCTTVERRAKFFSVNGISTNLLVLLAPIVANFLINISSNDMSGYTKILYLTIIVFVLVIIVSLTFDRNTQKTNTSLRNAFSLKDPVWRDHQLAVFIFGLLNQVFLTTSGILIYEAAGNGDVYSKCKILFSAVLMSGYRFLPRLLRRDNIKKTFIIGALINIFSVLILVWIPNIYSAIIFGIIHALANVLYDNAYSFFSGNIISMKPEETVGRVVARESILSVGRCVGMAFVILMYYLSPTNYLKISITILSITPLFVAKIFLKYK